METICDIAEEPGISRFIIPLVIILISIVIIIIMVYLIKRENRKRWRKQEFGYSKWFFENYSLKEATTIIEDLISKKEYKEAQRFIHEIMKVHQLEPGTYAWFFYKYNYALAKYKRYQGNKRKEKKVFEAIKILKELRYDPFVISDGDATLKLEELLEEAKENTI